MTASRASSRASRRGGPHDRDGERARPRADGTGPRRGVGGGETSHHRLESDTCQSRRVACLAVRYGPIRPPTAVAASDLILVNVVDQAAADAVLGAAGDAIAGRVVVGLSSDVPDSAHRTEEVVTARGGRYLDGAIMTPTGTIGTPGASILFAGPRDLFDAHRAVFEVLATVSWVGAETGRAAAFDMALLDVFWTSVSGFVHALAMAGAHDIAPTELLPHAGNIAAILPPVFGEIAERVEADRHSDASASVSSVAASVRHLIAASASAGLDAGALEVFRGYGGCRGCRRARR